MFLLALLGYQALASDWKSEADLEENCWRKKVAKSMQKSLDKIVTLLDKNRVTGHVAARFNETEFLDTAEKRLNVTFKTRSITRKHVGGGTWVHGTADEYVLSAYMHATKRHSAGIFSGKYKRVLPDERIIAMPGQWSIVFGNPGSSSRRHFPLYRVG